MTQKKSQSPTGGESSGDFRPSTLTNTSAKLGDLIKDLESISGNLKNDLSESLKETSDDMEESFKSLKGDFQKDIWIFISQIRIACEQIQKELEKLEAKSIERQAKHNKAMLKTEERLNLRIASLPYFKMFLSTMLMFAIVISTIMLFGYPAKLQKEWSDIAKNTAMYSLYFDYREDKDDLILTVDPAFAYRTDDGKFVVHLPKRALNREIEYIKNRKKMTSTGLLGWIRGRQ